MAAVRRQLFVNTQLQQYCSMQQLRKASSLSKSGTGGRSSFSGHVVTVFGASGFVGRYVVNRLGRTGSQVVCPFRGCEFDYRHLRLMGDLGQINFPEYDIRDRESVVKCIKYSDIVINLIGRDYETRHFKFPDVLVKAPETIAEACKEVGIKRLIHFSALNASKDAPSTFLRCKAEGEEAVRSVFPDATIMKPSDIFGKEDRFFNYYASLRMLPLGWFPMQERGTCTHKQPVYVVDVARAVMTAISDSSTKGQTYQLVGEKMSSLHDLVQYLYEVSYRSFKPYSPPKFMARFVSRILELNPFPPYMTRDRWTRLHLTDEVNPEVPGLEDLGITPTPLQDVAIGIMRRYRDFYSFSKTLDDLEPAKKT